MMVFQINQSTLTTEEPTAFAGQDYPPQPKYPLAVADCSHPQHPLPEHNTRNIRQLVTKSVQGRDTISHIAAPSASMTGNEVAPSLAAPDR